MDPVYEELVRYGGAFLAAWSAAWFLFRQQSALKSLIYTKFDEVKNVFIDKLEYHERHDDQRFDNVRKDLQAIQLQVAINSKNELSRPIRE